MLDELYNLIAEMIVYLLEKTDADFYKKYNSRTQTERDRERNIVCKNVPGLFEKDSEQCCDLGNNIGTKTEFLESLKHLFLYCRKAEEDKCILQLLELLDGSLEFQMLRELESLEDEASEECLNPNWNKLKLGIVPRCTCYWERGHRGSQHYDRLDNFLKNILIINYQVLGEMQVFHHFLPVNTFYSAEKKGSLSVAVSPFKMQRDFEQETYEREGTCYFSVQYSGNAECDNQNIKDIISEAAKEQVDILIFPEMLGNTMMVDEIAEYLQEPFWLSQNKPPAIISLPSVWDEHKNTVNLLNHTGTIICGQNKQEAYLEPIDPRGSAYEDIKKDYRIHLIHGIGIGRMAVMICKDFLTKDYLDIMLENLKVKLILIPSYSTGYHDFETMAGNLLMSDCCAVWANACGAIKERNGEERKVGFVLRSGRNTGKEREYVCIEDFCSQKEYMETRLKVWKLYYKTLLGR